ncbi:MAG: hypothetical protein ACRC06_12305 [Waterburya sp.]
MMPQYIPLVAAADFLNVSVPWFEAEVHPSIADKFQVVSDWMYSVDELDEWKRDRDAKRDLALDELARLDQELGLED